MNVLVLEGGGLRGAFVAGVMGELTRLGVPRFDDVVAVSSSAPTAAYYATDQVASALEIWREYTHSSQLVAPRNLLRGRPLLDLDRLVNVFRRVVPLSAAALATSPTRLWIGVTDCATGAARYPRAAPESVFDLLRASMALPIAYGRVVRLADGHAIDGGVAAPIALPHALSLAPSRLVVVLTRPAGQRRRPSWLRDQLIAWSYPRHPGARHAMRTHAARTTLIARRLDDLAARGELDVIRPDAPLPASRLARDRAAIHATIACGEHAARRWVAARDAGRVHDGS